MSAGSTNEAQHLKRAYYQLLLHLPECPLLSALFRTQSGLSLGLLRSDRSVHGVQTLLHRNGVLVSGNSVEKQCCTSPVLLGWVVW